MTDKATKITTITDERIEEFEAKNGRTLTQDAKGHWRLSEYKNYHEAYDEEADFAMIENAKRMSDEVDRVLNSTEAKP